MTGPQGPSVPGAPAALWKRHIVRQLRQRDRTQKALFQELVPACECGGASRMPWWAGLPAWAEGLSCCSAPQGPQHLSAPEDLCLVPRTCRYSPVPSGQDSCIFQSRLC